LCDDINCICIAPHWNKPGCDVTTSQMIGMLIS